MAYEKNPVLTNRSHSMELKAVGHADLIQDQNDNWWAVCLGIRTISYPYRHNLGRETMLVPVVWKKDCFPVFANNGLLENVIETDKLPLSLEPFEPDSQNLVGSFHYYDDFSADVLNSCWNTIYNPDKSLYVLATDRTDAYMYLQQTGLIYLLQVSHYMVVFMQSEVPIQSHGLGAGRNITSLTQSQS
ncbi:xylan 1 4-beta-xylosidase [Clostridium sp. CAG:230]|nr:xylan 1 4-beta-xylosidase [Clostridium sp. CAG:230]